jgi:toxin YoeB
VKVSFSKVADEDYRYWQRKDCKVFERVKALLRNIDQHPFTGIGKPEPLRHELSGWWSRRITKAHRLVYQVESGKISVLSCRFHYEK